MRDESILTREFERLALEEYKAVEGNENRKSRALYWKIRAVLDELRQPQERRGALIPFLQHPNINVRLKAAIALLTIEPDRAWAALAEIKATRHTPFSADAALAFINFENGIFVPT